MVEKLISIFLFKFFQLTTNLHLTEGFKENEISDPSKLKPYRKLKLESFCSFASSFYLLAAAFLLHPNCSFAAVAQEKIYRIGNEQYTKSRIIEDFLSVAFSSTLWGQEISSDDAKKRGLDMTSQFIEHRKVAAEEKISLKRYKNLEKQFETEAPWLWEYFIREEGYPKPYTINKWYEKISFGIDWPAYNENSGGNDSNGLPNINTPRVGLKIYKLVEDQIRHLLPQVEAITGLSAELILPTDKQDQTKKFAKIRVVPITFTGQKNAFKTFRNVGYSKFFDQWRFTQNEPGLFGAVSFTPYSRSQLDGYLLPNADSSLGLSVCKINAELSEILIRALITECVARSLGLPEALLNAPDENIGLWNASLDPFSHTYALDKFEDTWLLNQLDSKKDVEAVKKVIEENTDLSKLHNDLQPYAKALISILYCSEIKAGMDKYQVMSILSDNDKCFQKISTSGE